MGKAITRKYLVRAVGAVLLAAMSAQAQTQPAAPAASGPAATPAPAVPPSPPVPFDTALAKAAGDLFTKAPLPPGDAPVELVIDPLIDGVSGAQSMTTRLMEKSLIALAEKHFPRFKVVPFTTQALDRAPLVLVGTFTAINNEGKATGPRDAYRICLALADLASKKIVSKGFAKALPSDIDPTPTPAFTENPVWAEDEATIAYIKTCQGTKAGDPLNPVFIDRIGAASLISDGILEYDNKRYREALAFYRTARRMPGGEQLRVHNGIYLSHWKLNRRDDAALAFGDLVSFAVKSQKLAVRFLFRPGSTQFVDDKNLAAPYTMWLDQIAERVASSPNTCLEIVGHTSSTGPAALNERLSVLRAEAIKAALETADKRLAGKMIATGVGPRELLIGTGKDDASDALDRRVEFKVVKC
jgi:outer membrane protein OmpA-like peptidoglycan-associated protein